MIRYTVAIAIVIAFAACSSGEEQARGSDAPVRSGTDSAAIEGAHRDDDASARITLSEAAYQAAEIRVEVPRLDSGAVGEDLQVPGQVEFDPRRVALIGTRIPGRVERLMVVEGDQVHAGDTVALLYSTAFHTAQNDLVQARRRAALLAGTGDEAGARAIADAARRRLAMLGGSPAAITRLEETAAIQEHLALEAPFAGTIMESRVLTGQTLENGQEVFRLADLSVVDVVADIPERSLPLVRVGQAASITIAAYPGMQFAGAVERLRGELNPETRTVRAVIHAGNASRRLRPGMFATVRLGVLSVRGASATLTIPESAVVTDGERRYVFVEVDARVFERRYVEVQSLAPPGSSAPVVDRVAVRRGLSAGDRIAVAGAFTLKSELAKSALGEHGH